MDYNLFHKTTRVQKKIIKKNNFTYRHSIAFVSQHLKNKGTKILDYGCGVGTLDFYFAAKGYKVVGYDVSQNAIEVCRISSTALGLNENVKFVSENKIRDNFDVILCLEVIEHIEKDKELVNDLLSRLKKGGFLIISTPLEEAPLHRLSITDKFDEKVGHIRRYKIEDLVALIDKKKYKVEKIEKKEGVVRNAFFVFDTLGVFIRFFKSVISDLVTIIDNFSIKLFGPSNVYISIKKK